jgi:Sulfotransferase family
MPSPNPRFLRYTHRNLQNLANNAAHQFASQYALSIYNSDAIYSFIPKNACSTMRYTIGLANGTIADSSDFNWIHANNQTFRASLAELVKAKYTFAILRDPYLRVGSCYLDKMVDQTAVAWQYHAVTNYQTPPAMVTFREFIANLKSRLRSNEHWRPQLDFLVYQDYDDFFCFETFPEAIVTLEQRIGLEVHDARHLTKHGTDQFEPLDSDASFADAPAHEIAALKRMGRIPRIVQLYDASLIAEVGRMYAADIAFYDKTIKRKLVFSTTIAAPPPSA